MINLVVLGGNLVADPELKYTPAGKAVLTIRLAVNSRFTTAAGEKREKVLFIDVVTWGKSAEACAEYLSKGSKVLVKGELDGREWDDRTTGRKVRKIEVLAESVQFLSSNKKSLVPANGASASSPEPASAGADREPGEDDVPF